MSERDLFDFNETESSQISSGRESMWTEISMGHWWNHSGGGITKYSQENLSQCHFVQQYFTWTDLGSRQDCRFYRPAMNSLKHGTAELYLKNQLGPRSKHTPSWL
jgi:hypothetical protein